MWNKIIVGFLFIALPITTAMIWWHLMKRMFNGFDCPDVEWEFWEEDNGKS